MKMTRPKFAFFVLSLSLTLKVFAYDVRTHTAVTARATEAASAQVESQLLQRLGVLRTASPLGNDYVDIGLPMLPDPANANRTLRGIQSFEAGVMKAVRDGNGAGTIPNEFSITGWIMRGGIREDDNPTDPLGVSADEPGGMFHREFGHFFDPQNNQGLTVGGVNLGPPASSWGIDSTVAVPLTSVVTRRGLNHFGVSQAREAQWRALTLKRIAPDGSLTPEPALTGIINDASVTLDGEQLRKAYWASMFRAVGDVVHLVQDMAQPQHTRNDPHSGYGCAFGSCGGGHDSFYEKYIAARTIGATFFYIKEGPLGGTEPGVLRNTRIADLGFALPYQVAFNSYADFFSTGTGGANDASAKGLANYSNRGFYSAGTNIGSTTYPSPSPTGVGLGNSSVGGVGDPVATNIAGVVLTGAKIDFRTGSVNDAIGGSSASDIKLTTTGFWDEFLIQRGEGPRYSLSHYNYDAQAALLIPRAVAYSAGLIDYFFRGQLEITPPAEGIYSLVDHFDFSGAGQPATNATGGFKGFKTIKLMLRNITPDITPSGGGAAAPQMMTGGTLVAVLKFIRNKDYTDDLAMEPSGGLAGLDAYNAGRLGQSEEIVVSARVKDGISGAVLAGAIPVTNVAQMFVFEFDQELPINVTDVQLQVIYRGPLGSEADAVVVQTVDISEPTYLTYINATDYIKLGTSVFTRAEINAGTPAGAALRGQVRPTACIDMMTDQLKDIPACFQPYALNYGLKWGSATGNNATVNLPNERTYHRLAMLLPPTGDAIINPIAATCGANTPIPVARRRVQVNDDNSVDIGRITAVSGVRSFQSVACINIGDGVAIGPADDRDVKMTALTGANLKPLQMQGFGFGAP